MKISPTYLTKLTPEQEAERQEFEVQAAANRKVASEAQAEATARANGATVSLSEKSLDALRVPQPEFPFWGIVRALITAELIMGGIGAVCLLIVSAMR